MTPWQRYFFGPRGKEGEEGTTRMVLNVTLGRIVKTNYLEMLGGEKVDERSWRVGVGLQRDPLIHEAGRSRGAVAILITDSNPDIIAQAHSSPVDRSPTANVPLERRVFGCVGRSRPKREGQRCTLRCLSVPLAKVPLYWASILTCRFRY